MVLYGYFARDGFRQRLPQIGRVSGGLSAADVRLFGASRWSCCAGVSSRSFSRSFSICTLSSTSSVLFFDNGAVDSSLSVERLPSASGAFTFSYRCGRTRLFRFRFDANDQIWDNWRTGYVYGYFAQRYDYWLFTVPVMVYGRFRWYKCMKVFNI